MLLRSPLDGLTWSIQGRQTKVTQKQHGPQGCCP